MVENLVILIQFNPNCKYRLPFEVWTEEKNICLRLCFNLSWLLFFFMPTASVAPPVLAHRSQDPWRENKAEQPYKARRCNSQTLLEKCAKQKIGNVIGLLGDAIAS